MPEVHLNGYASSTATGPHYVYGTVWDHDHVVDYVAGTQPRSLWARSLERTAPPRRAANQAPARRDGTGFGHPRPPMFAVGRTEQWRTRRRLQTRLYDVTAQIATGCDNDWC